LNKNTLYCHYVLLILQLSRDQKQRIEVLARLKRQEKEADDAAKTLRKEFGQGTEDLLLQTGATRASSTNYASIPVHTTSPSRVFSAGVHEEKVLEEPDSTKVKVKQEGHKESTRKRPGKRLKIKATKKIFRSDGSSRWIKTFSEMVTMFDRLDLEELYNLVMQRFKSTTPEGADLVLWGDLRTIFDANTEDELLQNQERWNLKNWNFYKNYGVHTLILEDDPKFPKKVYKVVKAEYGLHQAPKPWYATLSTFLLKSGYKRGTIDKTLFIKKDKNDIISMIGSLMYLTASRPDIMFAVCACSRFQVTPKTSHLHAVKRIFRYLKGKPKLGLWYPRVSSFDLEAYSDSDYAGANLDRKSTTGGCQFLGRRLISWQCKKQTIMATSTTEAEYVAAANCCGQVLWIQNQMLDYGFNFMNTKIYIDNESTICIVKNPVFHSKTKHIEIRHHFIRDAYKKKLIQFWKSAVSQTVNNVCQIKATVSGQTVLILESSIRRDRLFNDDNGIDCLTVADIYENLPLMRVLLAWRTSRMLRLCRDHLQLLNTSITGGWRKSKCLEKGGNNERTLSLMLAGNIGVSNVVPEVQVLFNISTAKQTKRWTRPKWKGVAIKKGSPSCKEAKEGDLDVCSIGYGMKRLQGQMKRMDANVPDEIDGAKGEQVPNHVVKKGNLEFLVCKEVANPGVNELVDKGRPLKRKRVYAE
ncbi:putative ribonuclease H-like domain-containing protein, partial [Tanacetum coccineum]